MNDISQLSRGHPPFVGLILKDLVLTLVELGEQPSWQQMVILIITFRKQVDGPACPFLVMFNGHKSLGIQY